MNKAAPPLCERFYGLDILRGLAALDVVMWHWQHLFWEGAKLDPSRLPLAGALKMFYTRGSLGVDLFFALSGFVFAWLYATRIHEGKVPARDFAVYRFARLYPLHLATLVFVAIGQLWWMNSVGHPFVYPANDVKHFVLNFFFAQSWGIDDVPSFNSPTWSVSVEVLLYAIFFLASRLFAPRLLPYAALSIIGFCINKFGYPPIGRGLGSFYLGGCMFLAYRAIVRRPHPRAIVAAAIFVVVGWLMTIGSFALDVNEETVNAYYAQHFVSHQAAFAWIDHKAFSAWPVFFLFPGSILALALLEPRITAVARHFSFIGDVSYSSYLLHFPLQLVIVAVLGFGRPLYYGAPFMISFFAVLIGSGLLSYRYFERPMQAKLRASLLPRKASAAGERFAEPADEVLQP